LRNLFLLLTYINGKLYLNHVIILILAFINSICIMLSRSFKQNQERLTYQGFDLKANEQQRKDVVKASYVVKQTKNHVKMWFVHKKAILKALR